MNVACTQCGAPSVRGNRFCGRCGSPLPPSTGNLPPSNPASPARRAGPAPPTAPTATAATSTAATACWQCGGPVDLLHQVTCAACGARLVAGPPLGPPAGPTPPATEARPAGATIRTAPAPPALVADGAPAAVKEPLLHGPVLTLVVAILIVLALAVAGIVAGQAI